MLPYREKDLRHMIDEVYDIVEDVRNKLSKEYDVGDGSSFSRYNGLCDRASIEFINIYNSTYKSLISRYGCKPGDARAVHGELKHSLKCDSMYWPIQHTWVEIKIQNSDKTLLYVDATCGQFNDIFEDIPEYYVSIFKPKWYLKDGENIRFRKIPFYIDRHIILHPWGRGDGDGSIGIIEYIQFIIHGRISDFLRKVIRNNRGA